MTQVTLNLPPALIADLRLMAAERDETPGSMIRVLLMHEVARQTRRPAPRQVEDALVARLCARLAPDIEDAQSWADLDLRLGRAGFGLRLKGGAPMVEDATGRSLCALSDLGFPYAILARRFGRPMPRHLPRAEHTRAQPAQMRNEKAAEISPDGRFGLVEPT